MTTTLTIEINVEAGSKYCGECKYLSVTEKQQNTRGGSHGCLIFDKQIRHGGEHPLLPRLPQCIAAQAEKKDWIAYKDSDELEPTEYIVTIENAWPAKWVQLLTYTNGEWSPCDGTVTAYMHQPTVYNKNGV